MRKSSGTAALRRKVRNFENAVLHFARRHCFGSRDNDQYNEVELCEDFPNIFVGTRGGPGEAISPPKTYASNFIHYDLVQFGKQHSRYKAILS